MTVKQLWESVSDTDAETVSKLMSTPDAQSFINYQDDHGCTPQFMTDSGGHESV
jgi:hypothetical protein